MIPDEAQKVIAALDLEPLLPEGGFFKRTYASPEKTGENLDRPLMTCIYYLITSEDFSAFHRLKSDEIYHFYAGDKVELHLLKENGTHCSVLLGHDFKDCTPQAVVQAGVWQACRIQGGQKNSWALMGTTVAPGFDLADFELGNKESLIIFFPKHTRLISELTIDSSNIGRANHE